MFNDLRFAIRQLRKSPGFTAVAVFTLALGIGATTAIFSVADAVLLRPLAFKDPSTLAMVWETIPMHPLATVHAHSALFHLWKEQATSFDRIAGVVPSSQTLIHQSRAERVAGALITPDFLTLLGVTPVLGRDFQTEEGQSGNHRVTLISHGLWQRSFGKDPKVLGRTINLDGEFLEIVGVLPPGFEFPNLRAEVWRPLVPNPSLGMHVLGRLKPHVSLKQAEAEVRHLTAAFFRANPGWTARDAALVPLQEQGVTNIRPAIFLLLGAAGMLLLIATANVANLMLVRAVGRTKEFAIRTAVGAGRLDLARQLLSESVVLSLLGSFASLLVASWCIDFFVAAGPDDILRLETARLDMRVFGFSLSLAFLTALLAGLAPLLQAAHVDLNEAVKEGGQRPTGGTLHDRARRLIMIGQIALAIVLTTGAGLMAKSYWLLHQVDPGLETGHLLAMKIPLRAGAFESRQQDDFLQRLLERVQSLPGVYRAAITDNLPLSGSTAFFFINVQGPSTCEAYLKTESHAASPDYFRTMGIPLLKGRAFDDRDTSAAPRSVIINQSLASRCFRDADALGRKIERNGSILEIVGIAGDVKHGGLETRAVPEMYVPYRQAPIAEAELVVRTVSDPGDLANSLRNVLWAIDKSQPITRVSTMEQLMSGLSAQRRFHTVLLSAFAVTALVLAAIGVYGVVSYSMSQRTHEIGIRLALGASSRDVAALSIKEGFVLILAGGPIGLAAAFALTPFLRSRLFAIGTADPNTFLAVSLILIVIVLLACYLPARKATKVDPMVALRCE
jgi:putative ABC transport system permease protein